MGISKDRRRISSAEQRVVGSIYTQAAAGVGQNQYLMAAPTKCIIEEVVITSDTASTGSVAAAHYEFQVRNLTTSANLMAAAISTVDTDLVADTAYVLTTDQNNVVLQDDVIEFQVVVAGTPTDFTSSIINVQANYRPV